MINQHFKFIQIKILVEIGYFLQVILTRFDKKLKCK